MGPHRRQWPMPARRAAKNTEPIGASALGFLIGRLFEQFARQDFDDGHDAIRSKCLIVRRANLPQPRLNHAIIVARQSVFQVRRAFAARDDLAAVFEVDLEDSRAVPIARVVGFRVAGRVVREGVDLAIKSRPVAVGSTSIRR
jgi:hypothetical protein